MVNPGSDWILVLFDLGLFFVFLNMKTTGDLTNSWREAAHQAKPCEVYCAHVEIINDKQLICEQGLSATCSY